MKGKGNVVIIDDNEITRTLLRGILRQDGWNVVAEGKDAEQGLLLVDKLLPDVVCLDVMMPMLNGVQVLQLIKAVHPECAVLMITGSAERETVEAAIAAGVDGYVVKPFNTARVLDALRRALERRRAV
jgi:two-component system chemotaxis response regulator CheY